MIIIGKTLISDEIYTEHFVCDLKACKGACCVEGDAGAPLTREETQILEKIFPFVKPYLSDKSIREMMKEGFWEMGIDGEPVTPLVDGAQCAYVFYDEEGVARCAIEKVWEEGLIDFQKPLSCHLYPIRISQLENHDALNYHRWHICNAAVKKGRKHKVRIFRCVKDALIRKYGQDWYDELDAYINIAFEDGTSTIGQG